MALYLGIDSSTQSMKALVIDPAAARIVGNASVSFSADLPQYGCPDGVLPNADPLVKHADPLMWLAALDLLLARLQAAGLDMSRIAAIGGDGQQHGSVYLNDRFEPALRALSPDRGLAEQLAPALARPTSPIWMDSSTRAVCRELSERFGARLQADTGSPAIERFTGPQIRAFAQRDPERYAQTTRIHLVSSFLCSVLIGGDAPIDSGDGAGMNLLNLRTLTWDEEIAAFTAPGLPAKLPRVGSGVAGGLHAYFAKYGLRPGTPVAVWTGDNPASLVGTGAWRAGVAVVSLGTSDTFFAALDAFRTDPDGCGHVFGNPAGGFMSLACFKNGSLARDRVRQEAGASWDFFDNKAFALTPPGNGGRLALPWFVPEITPPVLTPGLRANFPFAEAAPEIRIRAVVEAQALALRSHAEWIGRFDVIRVTGGASRSAGIRQTLADVFQARVESSAVADSAALGSALLAAHADGVSLAEMTERFSPATGALTPRTETAASYDRLLPVIRELELSPAKGQENAASLR
ncbi:MAG TPA: FGGY family carbohydrate kinase [Kiritimatiellia bacterium]|nr:FGGY family carbohydrate kinase [Kiritimatiellia bacterium]HRU69805.1 FGGY family carbohydrate kinase [Kiritimatiellia bacterium]